MITIASVGYVVTEMKQLMTLICNKLAQKEYKTRYHWVEKAIYLELCKRLKSHHTSYWYMYKPESVLGNETHKILWDSQIQMDHLIKARRPNLV